MTDGQGLVTVAVVLVVVVVLIVVIALALVVLLLDGIRPGDSPGSQADGNPPRLPPACYLIKVVPRWGVWISATQTILGVEPVAMSLMGPARVEEHGIVRQERLQRCRKKHLCRPAERASTKPSPSIPFHYVRIAGWRLPPGAGTPEKPRTCIYLAKGSTTAPPCVCSKGSSPADGLCRHGQSEWGLFRKNC